MSLFKKLWSNYPSSDPCDAKDNNGNILFKNQCAIRMSCAMKKSGISFLSYPASRKCWEHKSADHILSAKELADWIQKSKLQNILPSINITGKLWRKNIERKKGIICFEDYYAPTGGSGGDHIDLWDGNSLTGMGSWFRTRFSVVVPGYWSDFRNSRKIRFFEVN